MDTPTPPDVSDGAPFADPRVVAFDPATFALITEWAASLGMRIDELDGTDPGWREYVCMPAAAPPTAGLRVHTGAKPRVETPLAAAWALGAAEGERFEKHRWMRTAGNRAGMAAAGLDPDLMPSRPVNPHGYAERPILPPQTGTRLERALPAEPKRGRIGRRR